MSDDSQVPAFGMVSPEEWFDRQWSALDQEGFANNAKLRAKRLTADIPLSVVNALATSAMTKRCSSRLRANGMRATADGTYKTAEQMDLPELQEFLLANRKRREEDARSEVDFVKDWCASHPGWSARKVYQKAGVPMPSLRRPDAEE